MKAFIFIFLIPFISCRKLSDGEFGKYFRLVYRIAKSGVYEEGDVKSSLALLFFIFIHRSALF